MDVECESIIIASNCSSSGGPMRSVVSVSAAFVGLVFWGCASASGFRQVSFAGETSEAGAQPPNGKTVHVVRNTAMQDTILEARIRYKLQDFLLARGYTIAASDTADLYVLATFGAGERMVASTASIFREAEVRVDRTRDGVATRRSYLPDRMEYVRVPL